MRAGQALEEEVRHLRPEAEVRHVDILDFTAKAYKKAYAGGYIKMVDRAPALWGAVYRASDRVKQHRVRDRFVRFFDKLEFAVFRSFVREFAPDVVFATHFLPCMVFAPYRDKGRDRFPLALVLTDFDAHAFWVQPTADRFFVGSDELRAILTGRGIDPTKIVVSGIPIMGFFSTPYDALEIRQRHGLAKDVPTVLVTSGGAGVGAMEATVQTALSCGPVQLLAVAGRNEALRRSLEELEAPAGSALRVFGFVENMAELMAVSHLAVAKSGGLTTSECLAMGLPMVVRDPIPGQEERNADYVLEAGAGLKAYGLESLAFKLRAHLGDPARLRRMAEAARSMCRPHAAKTIVEEMLREAG